MDARKRSVTNLQTLYTVVISLAVTNILTALVIEITKNEAHWYYQLDKFLLVGGFFVTIIPFYHGANRYLDSTYVNDEKHNILSYALLIDFLVLFSQAIMFFMLSNLLFDFIFFYALLGLLLLIDIIWVGTTFFTSPISEIGAQMNQKKLYRKWAILNSITIGIGGLLLYSELLTSEQHKIIFLTVILLVRTILDYIIVWDFYYPKEN